MVLTPGNLLTYAQQSCETSLAWRFDGGGSTTVTRSSTRAHDGEWSVKATLNSNGTLTSFYPVDDGPDVPADTEFEISMWVYTSGSGTSAAMAVDWLDTTGTYVDSAASDFTPVPSHTWTKIKLTATAPTGTAQATPNPAVQGFSSGATVYLDDFYLGTPIPTATGTLRVSQAALTLPGTSGRVRVSQPVLAAPQIASLTGPRVRVAQSILSAPASDAGGTVRISHTRLRAPTAPGQTGPTGMWAWRNGNWTPLSLWVNHATQPGGGGGGDEPPPTGDMLRGYSVTATSTSTLTLTVPSGVQVDDVLLFALSSYYPITQVVASPDGWAPVGDTPSSGESYLSVWWRRVTGTEPDSYTITLTQDAGTGAAGWMGALAGLWTGGAPFGTWRAGDVLEETTSATSPAASGTRVGDVALHFAATVTDDTSQPYDIAAPDRWTPAGAPFVSTSVTKWPGIAAVYRTGAAGTVTWTTSRSSGTEWATGSVALLTSAPSGPVPPTTPTGLAVGTPTSNTVPLTWDPVPGATGYRVYRGGSLAGRPDDASYTVTGLAASSIYQFAVSAVGPGGESDLSDPVTVTTASGGTLPAAPTGLKVGTVTPTSVALSWSSVPGADRYHVYRDGAHVTSTESTSYTAAGLSTTTTYRFSVSAANSIGEGPQSAAVSATTTSSGGGGGGGGGAVFFRDDSPINTKIPSSQGVASNSSTLVNSILRTKNPLLSWGSGAAAGGVPLYKATSSTRRYNVVPAYAGAHGSPLSYWDRDDWGANPFAGYSIPWDPAWVIPGNVNSREDDKWVTIEDPDSGLVYELWMTTWNYKGDGKLECWWGGISNVSKTNAGQIKPVAGKATGSNISTIAGSILLQELADGIIPHALTFSGDYTKKNSYVYPASASDGVMSGSQWVPEGTRIRLNPSYNPESDGSLKKYEKIIARALIDYGAYLIDVGGEGTTFGVRKYPADANVSSIRNQVGIPNTEWVPLDNIPWKQHLQVLGPTPNPGHY